jgi:hypothetical protein
MMHTIKHSLPAEILQRLCEATRGLYPGVMNEYLVRTANAAVAVAVWVIAILMMAGAIR